MENSLEKFQGWDKPSSEDFFKIADSDVAVEEEEKQEEGTEEILEDNQEEKNNDKKDEKPSDDFFAEADKGKQEEQEEEEQEEEKPKSPVLDFFKGKGLIEEDAEFEDEEEAYETALDNRVKEMFSEMPDTVKNFNRFVLKGGNPEDFIKNYSSTTLSEDLDISKEKNQEIALKEILKAEGKDEDEINEEIEFYKEKDKLESITEKKFNKWKTQKKEKEAQLIKQAEKAKQAEKEKIKEEKQALTNLLKDKESLGDLSLSKEDKKSLPSYMSDKTIKLKNGSYITELQKDLFYEVTQNEESFTQLAKLLKSRNKDGSFNFEAIKKAAKTNVAREYKDNIRRNSKKQSSGGTESNKSLAELFN